MLFGPAILTAACTTIIAITVRICASVTPDPWVGHVGGVLTAVAVLAWMWFIVAEAERRITERLDRLERRLDVSDLQAAQESSSVSRMRRN